MKKTDLKCNPELRKMWRTGKLQKEWRTKYPDLFDEKDFEIADNQRKYHFAEWLVAVHYHQKGYQVLVEQYIYNPHARKLEIIKRIIGENGLSFLRRGRSQPPDLFVYNKDGFFFAEVKMSGDKLRKNQKEFFLDIEKRFETKVVLLSLHLEHTLIR